MSTVSLDANTSVALLLGAQTAHGAFLASTIHEVYQYAWLRDGSWCAYALDRAGQRHAADAWHEWVATTLVAHADRVRDATVAALAGNLNPRVMLPARFTLAGGEEPPAPEEWPNFQTDCYGFWLWAAADHVNRGGVLSDTLAEAVGLVAQYLLAVGHQPCYDCWEEHPGHRHTSSLAAAAAGLRDAGYLFGILAGSTRSEQLLQLITGPDHTLAGGLVRYPGDTRVDGSLLWLGPPFNLLPVSGDLYRTTYQRVVDELYSPGGGVRRYLGDTFYGGGQWILLAASLGWAALQLGDRGLADDLLAWIESAANEQGYLPEQVAPTCNRRTCSPTGRPLGIDRNPRCSGRTPCTSCYSMNYANPARKAPWRTIRSWRPSVWVLRRRPSLRRRGHVGCVGPHLLSRRSGCWAGTSTRTMRTPSGSAIHISSKPHGSRSGARTISTPAA